MTLERSAPAKLATGFALGVLAAAPSVYYLRGFTVDDALIAARYATHLAHGFGYRFNLGGAATDGVTPLGWPYLLAPFAAAGPVAALAASRAMGVVAWLVAAGALGAAIAHSSPARLRYAALLLVVFSAPLGAWAVGGLETGVATALATFAAVLPPTASMAVLASALAGTSAWLRPEMIAWASVVALGRATGQSSPRARALSCVVAIAPFFCAALVRALVWGRPAPLAVLAKPSDLAHGVRYVLGAIFFTGAPLAALAPFAWRRLARWPRIVLLAALAHFVVVALAGGDWMALARLLCPVLPSLVFVVAHLLAVAATASRWIALARLALGSLLEIVLFAKQGPAAAGVLTARLRLIEAARPALADAEHIATIDVGWVGAVTDAEVIDLAGATDASIAALPGGHTSKAVSGALLGERSADRLVFLLAPGATDEMPIYARIAERRLAADALVARSFRPTWTSPEELPIRYTVLAPTR